MRAEAQLRHVARARGGVAPHRLALGLVRREDHHMRRHSLAAAATSAATEEDGFGAASAASAVDQGSSAGGGRGPGVGAPSARGVARSKSPRPGISLLW